MYLDNKYTKTYMSLIDSRKKLNRNKKDGKIYESHHIVPKCMGGSNFSSNKVLLTPREHFICHLLLTKMVESPLKGKMYCALVRFMGKNNKQKNIKINSKIYDRIIRENRKNMSGKNNPFYGKTHTEEVRQFISRNNKLNQVGEKNPFYGKKHKDDSLAKMSFNRIKPFRVYFFDGESVLFAQSKYLGLYLGKSTHLGAKLTNPQYKNLLKNYNIKELVYIWILKK